MLITNINDFKKIYEAEALSINFSTISSDIINFWNDIKTLGVDLNEFKKLFIEKFGEQSYKVLEAKLSSDQLASNYEDSNTELETTEFVNEFDAIIDFCNSYLVTYSANNTLITNESVDISTPQELGKALKKVFKEKYNIDIKTRFVKTVRGLDRSYYEISTYSSNQIIPNEIRKEILELNSGKTLSELNIQNQNDISYGNISSKNIAVYGIIWKKWLDIHSINESIIKKTSKPKYDITQSEKSLASAVAPLISKMEIMPLPDLKTEFTNILKDPSVHASEATRKKWFDTLTKATNKYSLMSAITNLYLKAAKLGLTESVENTLDIKKYLSDEEIYEVAYKLKQFFRSNIDFKKLGMMIKNSHYNNDLFPLGDISHITTALNSTSDEGTKLYLRTGLMTAFKDKGINIYQELGLTESSKSDITKEDNRKIINLLMTKISTYKYGNIRFDSLYDPVQTHIVHGVDSMYKDKLIKELKELGAKRFRTIKKNGFISIAFDASNMKDYDIIKNEKYYDRLIIKN